MFSILVLEACATDPEAVAKRQSEYEIEARVNEKVAEDWHRAGRDEMAEYHECKVDIVRHNYYAVDCNFFDYLLDAILDLDSCDTKALRYTN